MIWGILLLFLIFGIVIFGLWVAIEDQDIVPAIVVCFLIFACGIKSGYYMGEEEGMKKASKLCQLEERPYVVKDSTQIYLESKEE